MAIMIDSLSLHPSHSQTGFTKYTFIIFFYSLIFLSCKSKNINPLDEKKISTIHLTPNNIHQVERELLRLAIQTKIDTIYLSEGEYTIKSSLFDGTIDRDISIIGKGKVVLNIDKSFMYFTSSTPLSFKLDQPIQRKSIQIKKANLPPLNLKGNETVFLYAASHIEEGWKYKKGELLRVAKSTKNEIIAKDSTFFPYAPTDNVEVTVFSNPKVTMKNIEFRVNHNTTSWSYDQVLRFKGCRVELENISIINKKNEFKGYFCGFLECSDVKVSNFNCSNLLYGLGFDYSSDIFVDQVYTVNTLHPLVPATFTKNVSISNVSGLNSTLDAHLSINTTYKNVKLTTGKELFNCRSFGVTLENVHLTPDNDIKPYSVEIGVSSLSKQFEYLYDEYDVVLKNVKWVPPTLDFNGLHVHKCRNYILEDCEANAVSTSSFIKKFSLKNCKLGRLLVYDSNVDVNNCTFDQSLQRVSKPIPALGLSFDGMAKFDSCTFKGYSTLFSFLSSPSTQVIFNNCSFGDITHFCQKFEYPNADYSKIRFRNSSFNKKMQVPKEINSQAQSILQQQKSEKN